MRDIIRHRPERTEMKENNKLKKDTYLLCESAEEIYWHELEKPASERDEELMTEALRIIQSCSSRPSKHSRRRYNLVKRIAVIAACALLFIAVSTGVAAAMGINLWSIVFTGTNTGFEISGTNADDEAEHIDFNSVKDYNAEQASSFEEAISKLHINPLNFDLTKHGYMIDNIYITKNDAMIELLVTYMKSDAYVDVTVQIYNGGADSAFVSELLGEYSPHMVSVAGHDVYAADDKDSIICWADGEYIYQLMSNMSSDILIQYAAEAYD